MVVTDNPQEIPSAAIETFRGVVFPWHCDMMGHLATQHYMPLFDGAIYHLLGTLAPIIETEGETPLGWADVRHIIDYMDEIRAGDLLVLRSVVLKVGKSSITHRTYLCRAQSLKVCSILEGVTARFDLRTRKSVPLADSIRLSAMTVLAQNALLR